MRALFLGPAPGPRWHEKPQVLSGRSGKRLAELLGMELDEFREEFHLVNLLSHFPGKARFGKADDFPLSLAREKAKGFDFSKYDVVIMLGRNVQKALEISLPWLGKRERDGTIFFALPHPSGLCRWWNDPSNVEKASRALREILGRL